jgi:hypothetical protein
MNAVGFANRTGVESARGAADGTLYAKFRAVRISCRGATNPHLAEKLLLWREFSFLGERRGW